MLVRIAGRQFFAVLLARILKVGDCSVSVAVTGFLILELIVGLGAVYVEAGLACLARSCCGKQDLVV